MYSIQFWEGIQTLPLLFNSMDTHTLGRLTIAPTTQSDVYFYLLLWELFDTVELS